MPSRRFTRKPLRKPIRPPATAARPSFLPEPLEPRTLLAAPTLAWSTYLGGNNATNYAYDIAADPAGNALVAGYTSSPAWTSGGFDTTYNGGLRDAFIAKLSPTGQHLWSTYLGGSDTEWANAIAVDSSGNVLVTGATKSPGWITAGFDTTYHPGAADAFVAKLSPSGSLLWSTYLGGAGDDEGYAIAVDASDNILVGGWTTSNGWISGGFDTTYHGGIYDGFVAKLSPLGQPIWSTYIGGPSNDVVHGLAVDASNNVIVTGTKGLDIFATKLSPAGDHIWTTPLGSGRGEDIAVDGSDNVLLTGYTSSPNIAAGGFDTTYNGGGYDAFVAKLDSSGQRLWCTYLGGSDYDLAHGIAADPSGYAFIAGATCSPAWASGGFNPTPNGWYDAFVARLSPSGAHVWSSYLGGSSDDIAYNIALDSSGRALLTGTTQSSGWTKGGFDTTYNGGVNAFVAQIAGNAAPTAISLSAATISENQPLATPIGTLSATDPDSADTFTYTLPPDSPDNASFRIIGNVLTTAETFNYEAQTTCTITIRATDQGGLYIDKPFTISITPAGPFILHGTDDNDSYNLSLDTTGDFVQIHVNRPAPLPADPDYRIRKTAFDFLRIDAGNGDNSLTITADLPIAPLFNPGPGNNTLNIVACHYTLASDAQSPASNLTINVQNNATLTIPATQHLAALNIDPGSNVALSPGGTTLLFAKSLTISPTAKLDLSDNALVITADAASRQNILEAIAASIRSARNTSPLWRGDGITTSAAAANKLMGLAAILNDDGHGRPICGNWNAQPLGVNDVLVKYTINSDADLTGKLDASDYFLMDRSFLSRNSSTPYIGYRNGDFDYNDKIDASDYFLIDKAYLSQSPPPPPALAPLGFFKAPSGVQKKVPVTFCENGQATVPFASPPQSGKKSRMPMRGSSREGEETPHAHAGLLRDEPIPNPNSPLSPSRLPSRLRDFAYSVSSASAQT